MQQGGEAASHRRRLRNDCIYKTSCVHIQSQMASALDGGARSPTPEMPAELRAGYVPYVAAALQTAAGGGRQRTVAKDPLVEAAAQERELAYGEMLLVNAFEAATAALISAKPIPDEVSFTGDGSVLIIVRQSRQD